MIRRIARLGAAGIFLLGLANTQAAQQTRDRDRDDQSWYQSRDSFYREQGWRMRFFDRVRDDLNRIQAKAFTDNDDYRIERTKQELTDLQSKLAAGKYDEPELDSVIGALGKVVADNRLGGRDRDVLNDDLTRLRDYREHHENWR
jgi:hypothetical protein